MIIQQKYVSDSIWGMEEPVVNKRKSLLSQILYSRLGEADNKQVDKEMAEMLSNSYKELVKQWEIMTMRMMAFSMSGG